METPLDRNRLIADLAKSPHGQLSEYLPVASDAVRRDPEFYAHLTAWNQLRGAIRDSKLALPIIGTKALDPELHSNALAHLALQAPREFLRGLAWARQARAAHSISELRRLAERYVAFHLSETRRFRSALKHRRALKALIAAYHIKPDEWTLAVLFRNEAVGPNALLRSLATMSDADAAAAIIKHRIPFLLLPQALGPRLKSIPLAMAMIESMAPAQLTTHAKMLQKLGIDTIPELRAAYRAALARPASKPEAALKLAKAADALGDTEAGKQVRAKMQSAVAGVVKGDWLVIADVSASMHGAIALALQISALLAASAAGQVRIAFVNNSVRSLDATGKTLDALQHECRHVIATGGTRLGLGIAWAQQSGFVPDGIALVSDGGDNFPYSWTPALAAACAQWGKDVPVYHYLLRGDPNQVKGAEIFDLRQGTPDFYSLPNLVHSMRTNRFSLADEVFSTPLLTLESVLTNA